jgi:hypothetical protein
MNESFLSKKNRLEREPVKEMRNFHDQRTEKVFSGSFNFERKKNLKLAPSETVFQENLKDKFELVKKVKKVSKEIIGLKDGRRVPLLDLGDIAVSGRGCTSTRSYLTSYQSRGKKRVTTAERKNHEPAVFQWASSFIRDGDLKRNLHCGVAFCELINALEGKKSLKGFIKPAKSLSAAKFNLHKLEDYLKSKSFHSNFLNISEILSGSEIYTTGLLEDIKSFYDQAKKTTETLVLTKNCSKLKKFLESLGFSFEFSVNPENFGQFLQDFIKKLFKVDISSTSSDSSIQKLEKALQIVSSLCPDLGKKYLKRVDQILLNSSLLLTFLNDLTDFSYHFSPFCDQNSVVAWLKSLDLIGNMDGIYQIIPMCKTGQFFWDLIERVSGLTEGRREERVVKRIASLQKVFDVLFDLRLVENLNENVIIQVSKGDVQTISNVLSLIKEKCVKFSNVKNQPQEFNKKKKYFRSVTPPKSILII